MNWVLFWAGLHGRPRNMSLVHLTMTRHPETNGKAWNIGVEKYFICFQMNCSIQLEHADFFSFVSMGWFGSWFLDGLLSFVWAGLYGRPRNMSLVHLTMTRHPETNVKAWNIWLWKIFHIFLNELLHPFWACWISSFVSMGCLGIMPAEQRSHWLDRIEQEKMASTRVVPGLSLLIFNIFSMFNLCSAFYLKVACCLHFSFFDSGQNICQLDIAGAKGSIKIRLKIMFLGCRWWCPQGQTVWWRCTGIRFYWIFHLACAGKQEIMHSFVCSIMILQELRLQPASLSCQMKVGVMHAFTRRGPINFQGNLLNVTKDDFIQDPWPSIFWLFFSGCMWMLKSLYVHQRAIYRKEKHCNHHMCQSKLMALNVKFDNSMHHGYVELLQCVRIVACRCRCGQAQGQFHWSCHADYADMRMQTETHIMHSGCTLAQHDSAAAPSE